MSDDMDHRPAAVQQYWASMPNSVRALHATLSSTILPFITKEIRVEAWGQLCFDDAALRATAYHMWNHGMRRGWRPVSWRCEMDGPLVGGAKLSGEFPDNFSLREGPDGHPIWLPSQPIEQAAVASSPTESPRPPEEKGK